MNVTAIMATCGRHKLCERSLKFFIDQGTTDNHTLLIYNNSSVKQNLAPLNLLPNKKVILINNHIDKVTGERYSNLGAIYRDALTYVPADTHIIYHHDDDDIFLPNHISEGLNGFSKGLARNRYSVAYKPERSYFRHAGGVELMGNNLEPSVFIAANHLYKYGYNLTTTDQHMSWFAPLLEENRMFVDSNGVSTLIYNWGDTNIPTFKTSGNAGNPSNFDNYRNFSNDHGDLLITPWEDRDVKLYYNLVNVEEYQPSVK